MSIFRSYGPTSKNSSEYTVTMFEAVFKTSVLNSGNSYFYVSNLWQVQNLRIKLLTYGGDCELLQPFLFICFMNISFTSMKYLLECIRYY